MEDWLPAPEPAKSLLDLVRTRMTEGDALALGIGGGCDVISAYGIARILSTAGLRKVVYGNTKRFADKCLPFISPHIQRVPEKPVSLLGGGDVHGTTWIDQMVPRGPEGCPFILVLAQSDVEQRLLQEEIEALRFDLIVAVDTGGDSLFAPTADRHAGRDTTMLRVLGGVGLPLIHMVLAPGSDGELMYDELRELVDERRGRGELLGSFSLGPLVPIFQELASQLEASRTPNIILAAFEDRLEHKDANFVVVPRGMHPSIPRQWLTVGLVFASNPPIPCRGNA